MQYLQLVVGYAPFQSAVALTPLIVPIVVISLIAPRLAERYGLRVVTAPGMLLIAVGLYLVSRLGVEATYPDFLGPLLAMGAGLGLINRTRDHRHRRGNTGGETRRGRRGQRRQPRDRRRRRRSHRRQRSGRRIRRSH
ncbi:MULTISPECIES: MFS transporter [Mycobacteroides]|uniref:hypothetical protein n=1 Tax=Mycobacteroides TaxID=670516 RepID=UPI0005E5AF3D|nr:hypothetical protein [Mycobacteroides abscessus subsp. abscessus]MBV6363367.1 hypothetical protein [Mycobacteroides chelonae]CPV67898.1 arabinose efflux permease family protein [Mycobacteroides abscessus]MBN7546980.1 hypothetical protein [Mycobacteroides abscessus subsp. abscessus]MBN7572005.1 hypothetical protein [Mycobacteroides abscessus subsp. abscessus]